MGPLAFILELLSKLPGVLNAASRLVKPAKAPEPPPPVGGEGQADQYLRGKNNAKFDTTLTGDINRLQIPEEPAEAEKPIDE